MVSQQGMTIRFSEDDVRPMGRATAGVRGMKLRSTDDGVVSADVARDDGVLLFVSSSGHGKRTPVAAFNRQGRGGQGVRGMRVTEARGTCGRGVHRRRRQRDPRVLLGRQHRAHGRRRDLRAGPGRDRGTRAPDWPRAIPLWPWHRCSKPSRDDDGDPSRPQDKGDGELTDGAAEGGARERSHDAGRPGRAQEGAPSASRTPSRSTNAATCRRSARSTSGRCSRSRSASTCAR